MTQKLKWGEIWLADLNPKLGTEPGKTRPVLIIQSQALLDVGHPSTLIIPLTTKIVENAEPLRVRVPAQGALRHDSDLLIDQVRAIDNLRLVSGPLTLCDEKLMQKVLHSLMDLVDYERA